MMGLSSLKPLRRPRLWLGLWWTAIVLGVVVSLVPPPPIDVPRGSDKLVHLLSYGALAASAVQLFAQRSALLRAGIGLVVLGVALEFAQDALTSTRMLDPRDMLANACGVLLGLAIVYTPLRDLLLRLEVRLRL
jgi:VanZ family protein